MRHSHELAFDTFAAFGDGLACFEFIQLMDGPENRRNASARLSQFVKEGLAEKAGTKINEATGQSCVVYRPTGKTYAERVLETREPKRKRRRRYYDDEIPNLQRQIIALSKWKDAAIARFPVLGVDPLVQRAREQVSEILREQGQDTKAALVAAGELDDGETMRIVLAVMKAA